MENPNIYIPPDAKTCPTCGEKLEMMIRLPLFDGKGGTFENRVHRQCECERKKNEEEKRRREFIEQTQKIERLRRLSLMDEKIKNVTFDQLEECKDNRKALKIGRRYVEQFPRMKESGKGLLLWGNVGTGKSYLAAAIANTLMSQMHTVIMTSFPQILAIKSDFSNEDRANHLTDVMDRAELLIIDDLGAERTTDYALEQMYKVVDDRYRSNKPLILTTNLTFDQMKKCSDIRYNRIYDRIFEMCYPVMLDGMSWRKRKAMASFDDLKGLLEDGTDS